MSRRLVLHIGDCKTGSTILQTMLARGDGQPLSQTLFTPGQGVHGALARGLGDRKSLYPDRWQGVARRLNNAQWDVAVLSSELFEFIRPNAVARAVRNHLPDYAENTTVVAYVRPHIGRVLSQFAENLKLGHDTETLAAFVDRFVAAGRLQYAERLSRWKDAFGDRLVVRPFVRDRLQAGDVRHDFLTLLFGDGQYTLRDSGQDSNAALTVPDLAIMRLLQRRFAVAGDMPMDNRVAFGKRFGQLLRYTPPGVATEKLRLPRAEYDRLKDACKQDAMRMDADWFGGPCFVPELERAGAETIDAPQSLEASDYHGPETLRLMTAWADLLVRQMTDDPKDFGKRLRPPG